MTRPSDQEDNPNNVKPTPLKVPEAGRPQKEKDTVKDSKTKLDHNNRRTPSKTSPFKAYPLLKLNDFVKNVSEADSVDSNCDFVKKVDYVSDTVSSASCVEKQRSNEHDPKAKPTKTAQLKRSDTPVVKPSASKEREKDKERESKERKESKNVKDKEKDKEKEKEKDKEKEKEKDGSKLKKERETGSKGRAGAVGSKERKTRKENQHSKSDKGKDKEKEKDKGKEKSKDANEKKEKEKDKDKKKKKK